MPWYWHIGTFLGFFYMGTRAHFCTPNPSARVASSTQSKWPVACQTSPGSLSIGPTPILKLGVLLGHSSLSPATASACGAGDRLLGPFAFGAVPRPYVHCQSGMWHTRGPREAGNWLPPASFHSCTYSPLAWAWGTHCSIIARRPGPAEMGAGGHLLAGRWRLGPASPAG